VLKIEHYLFAIIMNVPGNQITILFDFRDTEELLNEIEDLKFQNRRLSDENGQLHRQLESQEELVTQRNKEEQMQKKKIKRLRFFVLTLFNE